jgi:hypothetical protein
MQVFDDVNGLDLISIKKDLSFPVKKERTHTEDDMRVNKDAVIADFGGEPEILGLVSTKRNIIPYSDVMDWVVSVFDRVGVSYKLRESTLAGKSKNLFQSYIFDTEVANPDGQDISPMFLLRSSHVGSPLHFDIGTYRFVCSNGVTVGKTLNSIRLKARDLDGLMTHDLLDDIKLSLDSMLSVSKRYQELADESMQSYLSEFLAAPFVPVAFKKLMIDTLSSQDIIENKFEGVIKGNDFLGMRLVGSSYQNRGGAELLKINQDISAWDLYNTGTEISSHQTRNVQARDWFNRSLSEIFVA